MRKTTKSPGETIAKDFKRADVCRQITFFQALSSLRLEHEGYLQIRTQGDERDFLFMHQGLLPAAIGYWTANECRDEQEEYLNAFLGVFPHIRLFSFVPS